jgi:glycosyltransferase involved in cell wall biosynthesis
MKVAAEHVKTPTPDKRDFSHLKDQAKERKIRILALCDSPTAATGFAQVSRNVLRGLANTGKYHIDVIGINYHGDYYDREKHPYNIFPAMPQGYGDMYGRGRLLNALNANEIRQGLQAPWDIIFTIQDPFVLEGLGLDVPWAEQLRITADLWRRTVPPEHWFKWIAYWPVDAGVKENWVTRSIALPHFPVAYCEWGKQQMLKWDKKDGFGIKFKVSPTEGAEKQWATVPVASLAERIKVIHHGVDLDTFKPISPKERRAFRKEFFQGKVSDDTFLVVNVSRNQPRKDIARTMMAFAEFKKRVPKSHLYLHMKSDDAGGSIDEMARNFNLAPGRDYSAPADFNAGIGFPIETVNKIYNIADAAVTTTLGEGWGFITTEAMATKTPIVAPNITSILDIFDSYVPPKEVVKESDGTLSTIDTVDTILTTQSLNEWWYKEGYKTTRGIPVLAGSTSSEWICMGLEDNERVRPLTNVDDLVEKLVWVYEHKEEATAMVERAYKWVQSLSWENIVAQWEEVFDAAYANLESDRKLGELIDKAGRNDICPCGSGLKFKKCHADQTTLNRFQDWLEGKKA